MSPKNFKEKGKFLGSPILGKKKGSPNLLNSSPNLPFKTVPSPKKKSFPPKNNFSGPSPKKIGGYKSPSVIPWGKKLRRIWEKKLG